VGAIVFLVAVGSSAFCARGLSTVIAADSPSYFTALPDLLRPEPGEMPTRTPFYPALVALVYASGGVLRHLLAFQAVTRGLACAAVAWHLANARPGVALAIGLVLAADPVGASMTSAFLSESLYSTGLLLALTVLVSQWQDATSIPRARLVGAGVLFGWVCLFRPSGLALIVPAVAAYAVATRSLLAAGWVATGFFLATAGVALFNYAKYGALVLAATGYYIAFPLFTQHLFAPANGPASAAIHAELVRCDPAVDYEAIVLDTANAIINGKFFPCLVDHVPGGQLAVSRLYRTAYGEAFRQHPLRFAGRMLVESLVFLGTPVSAYVAELAALGDARLLGTVCARQGFEIEGSLYGFAPEFGAFVCPIPPQDPATRRLLEAGRGPAGLLHQPHVAIYAVTHLLHMTSTRTGRLLAGVAGCLFLGFAVVVARPPYRPWVVGAVTVVVVNAATTALAAVTLVRYAAVTSPFLLLISGLTLTSLLEKGSLRSPWRSEVGQLRARH
jgi:hypothetical protein